MIRPLIIDRYLIREILITLVAVTSVLLLIFLSSTFIRFLGLVATGDLPGNIVMKMVFLKGISNLDVVLPLSYFFAVLLSLGRFYRDQEMTALQACGVGQLGIMKSVLLTVPLVVGLIGYISVYASPWAVSKWQAIQQKAKEESDLGGLAAGRFKEASTGNLIVYVEQKNNKTKQMQNVFVETREKSQLHILSSEKAHFYTDPDSGDEFIVMVDGYRYEGEPGSLDFHVVKFREHGVRIQQTTSQDVRQKNSSLPVATIWNTDNLRYEGEFQRRVTLPFSALLFALLAVPLSRSNPREGRFARIFSAVLIYVIYNNLMNIAQSWLESGIMPRVIGMWWVPLLLLLGTIGMMIFQGRAHLWWLDARLRKRVYG
jgi:lipopolysaccharide export system permease protein